MDNELKSKTAKTAELYFEGYQGERPYELWKSFDKSLAKDLSLFITGKMYAREKIPHKIRQLVAIAALTALERREELKLHIYAGFNVGLTREEIAEAIFQVGIYAGMPVVNTGLKVLKEVIDEYKF